MTQSATFRVGGLEIELTAAPGVARLVASGGGAHDTYVVDPAALAAWAAETAKLLDLAPAAGPADRIELRAPYLMDHEGRASIAFEGLVTAQAVTYRLLVKGAAERVAGIMTTAEIVREVSQAAAGAASLARSVP